MSEQEQKCFGTLVKREIPQFRNYGLKDFVNSDCIKRMYVEKDTIDEMRLPYNLKFTPYLVLDAPKGKKTMKAENYHANAPGEKGVKSVYIMKNGLQEYEALGWLNGKRRNC